MSDEPLNTESTPKNRKRRASGAQVSASMASVDRSLGNFSREEVAHGEGRAPRVSMSGADMRLSVAKRYTSNPDYYYRWCYEGDGAKIERMKAAYYDHVTDENGANISIANGTRRFFLMALHKKYRAEDDKLKRDKYNAIFKAEVSKTLGVDGLEDYTDSKVTESASIY